MSITSIIRENPGDTITTAISVVAAVVAIWQAVLARTQAKSAREAAKLAERQAVAAEQQVDLMRQQLNAEHDDRVEAWSPEFNVTSGHVLNASGDQPYAEVILNQVKGRELSEVVAQVTGQYVGGFRGGYDSSSDWHSTSTEWRIEGMSVGGRAETVPVQLEYRHVYPVAIRLELTCTAREGGHTWTQSYNTAATEPPPEPARRRRGASF
ncbi:hypothetical protein [Streptomyces sp. NPDC001274]